MLNSSKATVIWDFGKSRIAMHPSRLRITTLRVPIGYNGMPHIYPI